MQVAALLSDLKSLSACDHPSALKLVTVHKNQQQSQPQSQPEPHSQSRAATPSSSANLKTYSASDSGPDPDLGRAQTLLMLHYAFKPKDARSSVKEDEGLVHARESVDAVLRNLQS